MPQESNFFFFSFFSSNEPIKIEVLNFFWHFGLQDVELLRILQLEKRLFLAKILEKGHSTLCSVGLGSKKIRFFFKI
jgi:hypothetical protein